MEIMAKTTHSKFATGWLTLSLLCCLSALSANVEYPDFQESIEKIVKHCKLSNVLVKVPDSVSQVELSVTYSACFTLAMVKEMRKAPQYRELILESALRANSEHIPALIEAAINAGMAPLVTLMRAIEIYPQYGEDIRKGAMSAGVDPVVVTEATSGLLN